MDREYDLDECLQLPDNIVKREIGDYTLAIAPEYPNWLVMDKNEAKMFSFLQVGTIRQALEFFYKDVCQDEERCLDIMTALLSQIDDVNFFSYAEIHEEEPAEKIKKKIHIGTTNSCNMHCMHCYMAAGTMPLETVNLQKTVQIINRLNKKYGQLEIVVSGGEPLTFPKIGSLLRAIKDNYVILFTNGSLINDNNIEVIADCCNEVQISFEGLSKDAYGRVRGYDNYERVINALHLLMEHNIRIVLAVTILPSTLQDVKSHLISFVSDLKYNNLEVRLSDEIEMSGNALSMDISSYDAKKSKETIIELVHELNAMGCIIQGNDIRNTRFTNCGIGTNIIINYDGFVYPCHKFSDFRFPDNANVEEIIQQFNKINNDTSNLLISKCQTCDLQYICSGGCRIDNYNKNGDMLTVSCNKTYKEEQYRRLVFEYLLYH